MCLSDDGVQFRLSAWCDAGMFDVMLFAIIALHYSCDSFIFTPYHKH